MINSMSGALDSIKGVSGKGLDRLKNYSSAVALGVVTALTTIPVKDARADETAAISVVGDNGCSNPQIVSNINIANNTTSGTIDLSGFCQNSNNLNITAQVDLPQNSAYTSNQVNLQIARDYVAQLQGVSNIPTLSEYGMAILAGLLLLIGSKNLKVNSKVPVAIIALAFVLQNGGTISDSFADTITTQNGWTILTVTNPNNVVSQLRVRVTNNGNTLEYEIVTNPANNAPPEVPPIMGNVPNQVITAGQSFNFNLTPYITQTNGDSISGCSLTGTLPTLITFNPSTCTFSGSTTQTGTYNFSATASDNDGTSNSDSFTLTVNAANQVPTANAGPDQTITEGNQASLSAILSSDNDGTIVAYRWKDSSNNIIGTNASLAINGLTASGSPYTYTLEVQDNNGAWSVPDSVSVTVNAANQAPVASDGSGDAQGNNYVTIDFGTLVSDDTDTDSQLTFEIVSDNSPTGLDVSGTFPVLTFTNHYTGTNWFGSTTFTYRVKDTNLQYSQVKTISITNVDGSY